MRQVISFLMLFAVLCGIAYSIYARERFMRLDEQHSEEIAATDSTPAVGLESLLLSKQAIRNLGLRMEKAPLQTYWRTIQIPGTVVDRPGRSDRGVTSPAMGVVSAIHAYPGDTVRPGDPLFTLRLVSEYLQNTQKEFFSSTREIALLNAKVERLRPLAQQGGVPQSQVIELENQLQRQSAVIQSHRQDLLTRGLTQQQIESVAKGAFVAEVEVVAPPLDVEPVANGLDANGPVAREVTFRLTGSPTNNAVSSIQGYVFEVQELNADLGQQVQAGQLLSTLANHSLLYIEGHAFKREAPSLERAAQNSWALEVEFAEDDPEHWPPIEQDFVIRHLANAIDPDARTFDFFVSLRNQSRSYRKGSDTFMVWRFRPGQRVRLHVPVEKMENVLVLPAAAVALDGPEAYVFRQSGGLFYRINVNVLHQDRLSVVLADDGSIEPNYYLAQSGAASLNRAFKSQTKSNQPNVHVHADGTVHASH